MARRGRNNKRNGRARRSRTSRIGRTNNIPAMPPSLDLQSNVFSMWLRTQTGVKTSTKYWVNAWTVEELLTTEYKSLMTLFAEYRLKRINLWFIPSVAITSTGVYSMATYDDGTDYLVSPTLSDVSSAPGAQTAKVYQPCKGVWHRTEPSDRNWLRCNDTFQPLVSAIATSASSIEGVLILDIKIAFRGLKQASTVNWHELALSYENRSGFSSPFEVLPAGE